MNNEKLGNNTFKLNLKKKNRFNRLPNSSTYALYLLYLYFVTSSKNKNIYTQNCINKIIQYNLLKLISDN